MLSNTLIFIAVIYDRYVVSETHFFWPEMSKEVHLEVQLGKRTWPSKKKHTWPSKMKHTWSSKMKRTWNQLT